MPVPEETLDSIGEVVRHAITTRRSVKAFKLEPVPREVIADLIECAVWAPNHRLTQPWCFYVLDGDSRHKLGDVAANITREKIVSAGGSEEIAERKAAEAAATWARVPALLFVTSQRDANPEIDLENYGATCCAVQNLMLAAYSLGLGTSWSSGAVAASEGVRALAGAGKDERLVGLIRLGYPDPDAPVPQVTRASGATRTIWVDERAEGVL